MILDRKDHHPTRLALLALALLLALPVLLAAQSSANHQLRESTLTAGGNPQGGGALTSATHVVPLSAAGNAGATGAFSADYTLVDWPIGTRDCVGPSIRTQPLGRSVPAGSTATLSVSADGTDVSYQWFRGASGDTSAPVGGAVTAAFTTPPVTAAVAYWVRVTNLCGRADSAAATLTPVPPPVVTAIAKAGGPFRLKVTGSNLQNGITVSIGGTPWPSVTWKSTTSLILRGGASLKAAVPRGQPTRFVFLNPDGGRLDMTWQW